MIKLLVFDMDGTLLDTDDVIISTWLELFKVFKPKDFKMDIDEIKTFSGPPLRVSLKKVFPERDTDFMYKEYDARGKKYYDTCLKTFPNAVEVLTKFRNDGYKIAILTSKNRLMTEYSLKIMKMSQLFDYIVSSDDITKFKPDPQGINMIMTHFHVTNEETINIGDTEFDYFCGKNANVKTIMMTMKNRKYESKIFPFAFCSSYNELYEVVKKYDNK